MDTTLHITNGDYFNEYFLSKFGGIAIPFREAMMDGDTVAEIYSNAFIRLRARQLRVSEAEYRAKMQVYEALNGNDYFKLCLWFGKDTFCQMNLLTLLAYLEQIAYRGEVALYYIDDETFAILRANIPIQLGVYTNVYKDVLLLKQFPKTLGVLDKQAIDLYFDYHANNGALTRLIKENADKDKTALVYLLLERSKAYGLSVSQAEKLIDSNL